MSMGGGGGGSQTTTQTSEPWSEQKPYLTKGFSEAEQIYNQGPQEYYPGQTYVDQADATQQGLAGQINQAGQPTVTGDASGYAANTLQGNTDNPYASMLTPGAQGLAQTSSGAYLNSNPYLDQTFNSAAGKLRENFTDTVMPNIGAQFGMSGGAGSALHQELAAKAGGQFTDSLSSLASDIYGGNYQAERARQDAASGNLMNTGAGLYGTGVQERMGAAGLAPTLDQAGYLPSQMMQDAGQKYEAFGEKVLSDDINRFNFEQNAPLASLQDYMSMITGNYGGTSVSNASQKGSGLATGLGSMATLLSAFG
jgi:hypothetical protein